MEKPIVAVVQPRLNIVEDSAEFLSLCRRYLRQAQAKSAQVVIFPELAGLFLAPPLISRFKLGFIKRMDQGRQASAGLFSRAVGRVADATATALGGGLRGSLSRLLDKNSQALRDSYLEVFGSLAREYGMVILGGSLYLRDEESGTVRNRAYLFGPNGEPRGYLDKLNLTPAERELVTPGSDLRLFDTPVGRLGVLIGRDALYPELARYLALLGADLLTGIDASPDEAQARVVRSALALRAEENQIYTAASFLLGPNYLDSETGDEYVGQSALLAPISLTAKGDGVVVQTGTARNEGVVAAELDLVGMRALRASSRFRPRQEMVLGTAGTALARIYADGLTLEQAIERGVVGPHELEAAMEVPEAAPSAEAPAASVADSQLRESPEDEAA